MKIDILTIFPEFFRGPLDFGIIRRAKAAGLVTVDVHDLRAFAHDRHRTVDDRPFGGGEGMVLKPEPIFECIEALGIASQDQRQKSFTAHAILIAESGPNSTCGSGGLLDYPHYTRPAEFRGMPVPEVLVSGNHDEIRRWRRRTALEKTLRNRPDLLERFVLNDDDQELLARIRGNEI